MTNNSASQLIAAYLKKHAAEMPQQLDPALLGAQAPDGSAEHEQAESPEHEMAEHQPGGYEAGGEEGAGGHEAEIEHLLSQLSPEELEQLANELAGDMHHGAGGHEGAEHGEMPEDVPGVADAIHSHLAENPEAELPGGSAPEKVAALNFVKSAAYIEGFVEQAVNRGASIKQAVDMYDEALAKTINNLKMAAQLPGTIMAKTKIDKMTTKTPHAPNLMNSIKTAAYYEGVIERAREYGLSDQTTIDFVKSAMVQPHVLDAAHAALKGVGHAAAGGVGHAAAEGVGHAAPNAVGGGTGDLHDSIQKLIDSFRDVPKNVDGGISQEALLAHLGELKGKLMPPYSADTVNAGREILNKAVPSTAEHTDLSKRIKEKGVGFTGGRISALRAGYNKNPADIAELAAQLAQGKMDPSALGLAALGHDVSKNPWGYGGAAALGLGGVGGLGYALGSTGKDQ